MIKSRRQDSKVLSEVKSGSTHLAFSWCRRPLSAPQERLQKKITALNILGFFASERNARICWAHRGITDTSLYALAPLSLFFILPVLHSTWGPSSPTRDEMEPMAPALSLASHWGPQISPTLVSLEPVYNRDTSVDSQFSWLLSTTQN